MQKLSMHLWFDTLDQLTAAADLYINTFFNSKKTGHYQLHDTPSGDCDVINLEIAGFPFTMISAGPYFKANPSISFHVACKTAEEVDALWEKLIPGGEVKMELGAYPFSERYGWVQDKFGFSWQIIHIGDQERRQVITPILMFTQNVNGKAEEAVNFYASVFKNAKVGDFFRYTAEENPEEVGKVKYAPFTLEDVDFGAMDGGNIHDFTFNEAISIIVNCETQEEIDYYWEKLSAVPESEQCGWLKDKYGVSWQVVPASMDELLMIADQEKLDKITQAVLQMKKLDLNKLQEIADEN